MLSRLYNWYGKGVVRAMLFVVLVLAVLAFFKLGGDEEVIIPGPTEKSVRVASIRDLAGGGTLSLIGSVEAVNESVIRSETGGRIVRVHTSLGASIGAGSIIAELENASERAAVLQAEGAYEAALAAANQLGASLEGTEESGKNTYLNALTTADNVVRNTLDDMYNNPESGIIGFRLSGADDIEYLNNERRAVETTLKNWSSGAKEMAVVDVEVLLLQASSDLARILTLTDMIAVAAADDDNDGSFIDGVSIATIRTDLSAARSTLIAAKQSVDSALVQVRNARSASNADSGQVSAADAQVKQALGALRAAQANLAKTIIRTSIAGTVNALPVSTGDFINSFTHIATVANDGSLLITSYISEVDRNRVAIGDSVIINETTSGTITNIAPSVDPLTKKIELKIATDGENVSNGDTVRISIAETVQTKDITNVIIPVSSLKVETDRTIVFSVSPQNTLVAHPVETGPLVGNSIIIETGITVDMQIVTDARGLNEGDTVTILE